MEHSEQPTLQGEQEPVAAVVSAYPSAQLKQSVADVLQVVQGWVQAEQVVGELRKYPTLHPKQ